ncbi:hypothetical protein [Streptomyces sp. NPDC086787]|uniref:hypothetical protein n=1 Tax=Streptomyces sp. NPDC086787 TaxID=3365759 RepID=UPI003802C129
MGAMSKSVPVRCPACRSAHVYTAPSYPCVCGARVAPPLDRSAPATVVTHRVWDDDWVMVRCPSCGRRDEWPQPELGCDCGTLLRIPVADPQGHRRAGRSDGPGARATAGRSGTGPPGATGPVRPRPVPQPVTIRTARDAVTAVALYLRRLGHQDIRRADQRPPAGIGLAARGIVVQVDPTAGPASPRDVECLWLTAMTDSANCVYFSLAGYTDEARASADLLGIPLFVLTLTGTAHPVNGPAVHLDANAA